MFRKLGKIMVVGLAMLGIVTGGAVAGEVDLLVQKLVEKGVLSPNEAQILMDETKQEVAKQNAKGTNEMIPAWVQTVKVKGDFRARYEGNEREGTSDTDMPRHRNRIRMRLGVEAKPNDQMKVGVGIATGDGSARSTNQTLSSDNSELTPGYGKLINLDYAYAQYTPLNWVTITAGKFKNPLWQPADMLWDTDINTDGAAVQLQGTLMPGFDVFMNNLAFPFGETKTDRSDPYMLALQPGFSYNITDKLTLKGALVYYAFNGVQGTARFTNSNATNTVETVGGVSGYKYNYNAINPSVELGLKEPFGGLVPYVSVFADYVKNVSARDKGAKTDGYDSGFKFGAEKIANFGDWQFKGIYAYLQRDAWLDIFPDSDRYGGRTNMKSYEAALEFGLGKNTSLALDYYQSTALDHKTVGGSTTHEQERVVQVDWNLKF